MRKDFIRLFGSILSMRNILSSFDQFEEMDSIAARDLQNYQSIYLDLYDKYRRKDEAEKKISRMILNLKLSLSSKWRSISTTS